MLKRLALALSLLFAPASAMAAIQLSTNTPTISTSGYSALYAFGGAQAFPVPAGGGIIQNATVALNTGAYVGGVDLLVFSDNPSGGGTTDHAAMAIVAADMPKLIGVIHLSDCKLTATVTSYCTAQNVSMAYQSIPGGRIYGVAQMIGTPTFAGASDATFTLGIIQ